tara:strand:- start:203 stop:415 length:213 start_codon:yes stop_codon:yes gene_type:complete
MYVELLIMNGYGQFVWPAFMFTLVSFFYLYAKTKYELKQQEKIFLIEFAEVEVKKFKFTKESTKEALSIN